jgi:hypothetical protein
LIDCPLEEEEKLKYKRGWVKPTESGKTVTPKCPRFPHYNNYLFFSF